MAETELLVSVVLNTYNRSHLVSNVIAAVLRQTHQRLELIVVDDGSTDDTATVVQRINDPRLHYVYQTNSGLSVGRNTGIKLASGQWLACLDDDDSVEPEWLEAFVNAIEPDVGLVFSGHKTVNTATGVVIAHPPEPLGRAFASVRGGILAGTWLARMDVVDHTGGFMEGLATLVQSEFLLRATTACADMRLRMVTTEATHFRYSVTPLTSRPTTAPSVLIESASMILYRHRAAFSRDPVSRANWNAVIGVTAARMGDVRLARRHFARSVMARPFSVRCWCRLGLTASRRAVCHKWKPLPKSA